MSKKLHATQIQSLRKLEPPEMAVFRHSRYRYFWEKCYGNPYNAGPGRVRTLGRIPPFRETDRKSVV